MLPHIAHDRGVAAAGINPALVANSRMRYEHTQILPARDAAAARAATTTDFLLSLPGIILWQQAHSSAE
jgi:hypothetical protein